MKRIRTVSAVFKKEFILLVRYPTWIIQIIVWPLIIPLAYVLSALGLAGPDRSGLEIFASVTGTDQYIGYIVIGTMMWMWVNSIMWTFGSYLRNEQMLGTLESNWLCPVKRIDLLSGAGVMSVCMAFFMCLISIIEYRFIYGANFTGSIFHWLLVFLIMIPGVYGFASCFASLVLWIKESSAAVNVVRGLVMILCGISFPVEITPIWMQGMAKLLPFTYGIKAARELMVFGKSISEATPIILMTVGVGMIYVILGKICFTYTESKVKIQGSLGRY